MLNDKSFKQDMAEAYAKYGIVEDEYDDEYDDTYESHDVGLHGADDSLEMDAKLFTTPRVKFFCVVLFYKFLIVFSVIKFHQ